MRNDVLCTWNGPSLSHRDNSGYTYPEVAVYEGGGSGQAGDEEPRNQKGIPQRGIDVTLTYRVGLDRLSATAMLGNRTRDSLTFELSWILEADFADIQEAQAGRREQEAAVDIQPAGNEIRFAYQHNDSPYIGAVSLTGGAWRVEPSGAAIEVALPPEATMRVAFEARVIRAVGGEMAGVEERTAFLERWRNSFTRIRSPRNGLADQAITGNVRDYASFPLVEGAPDEWLTLQAGVPLYPALFGRDAITAGCVDCGQSLDAALTRLGRLQSDRVDEWRDEGDDDLRRFGFTARANDLARALFDLAALYPEQRIPECVGGYPRATHPAPGAYPQANAPQLWNATAFPLTVQTLAGIVPLAPYDTLIVDPALPDWLPELVFQNLCVGGATATLRFWRDTRGRSKFQVLHKRGTLHVVRQPPPESLSADLWQRLHGVMESVA